MKTLVWGVLCACAIPGVWAAEGDADPSFGKGGVAKINAVPVLNHEPDAIFAAARGRGDRMYVVGTYTPDPQSKEHAYIARLLPNGALDTGFGTSGIVTLDFGIETSFRPRSVTAADDGGVVVAGLSTTQGLRTTVCKFDAAGEVDATFGAAQTPGCRLFDAASESLDGDYPMTAIAQTPVGQYIVAMTELLPTLQTRIVVAQLDATGQIDDTFGVNGFAFVEHFDHLRVHRIAVRENGAIVVAGARVHSDMDWDVFVAQVSAQGVSGSGTSTPINLPGDLQIDAARGVAIRENGEIVVAGSATSGADKEIAVLLRYNQDLDLITPEGDQFPSPDFDPVLRSSFLVCDSCATQRVTDMVGLSNGGLFMVGDYTDGADVELFAIRIDADWQLDTGFGSDGMRLFGFNELGGNSLDDSNPSLITQCGDRPVIAAMHGTDVANSSMGVTRLLNDTVYCNGYED